MQNNFNFLAGNIASSILSIVIAILILLLTITVHEFGHYIVGKILKFKINEFAIGMGPAIFKKKLKNGEIFSIRAFPLGGFCAFEGEDQDEESIKKKKANNRPIGEDIALSDAPMPDGYAAETAEPEKALSENAFNNKKPWKRILVLLAGATMNFIFALIIVTVKFLGYGHFELKAVEVMPYATGAESELKAEDTIIKVNGKYIYLTVDYITALKGKKKGDTVALTVVRNGEKKDISVTLRNDVESNSMEDVDPCLAALGIGTVVTVTTSEDSAIKSGSYLFRFADYENEENYALCTRIYSLNDLYERLKDLHDEDCLRVWIYKEGDEKRTLATLTAPVGFDLLDKNSVSAVLGAFGISDTPASTGYQLSTEAVKLGFFEALLRSPAYAFKTLGATLRAFGQLLTGKLSIRSLSGPVGTVSLTSEYVSSWRLDYILEIAALIGLSIAIFNVLPIPALDGARTVFVVIEWIRGKPINRNVEATIHFVGLIVLIAFAVLVDVLKFIT